MRRNTSAAIALALAMAAMHVHAGRPCEEKAPTARAVIQGMALAKKTFDTLDASDADVVVLARAGQDLTKWGLRYSHMAFAYRDRAAGRWLVVHKLNQCGTADATLYRQGLGEFFLDNPARYVAAWTIPSAEVQRKLLPVLLDDRRVAAVNTRPYSLVSYAWGRTYQQSNQWAIETLAVAMTGRGSRAEAQDWLASTGYVPTTLRIDALTRLGGRLTKANVAFDDHPPEKRFSDRIETVTVDSVFDWMQRSGMASTPRVITLD